MRTHARPRTFTAHEEFVRELQQSILTSGMTYERIATDADVSKTTVSNIANGTTKWPRHTTLFALCQVLGLTVTLSKR